jgi:hypothetical protein
MTLPSRAVVAPASAAQKKKEVPECNWHSHTDKPTWIWFCFCRSMVPAQKASQPDSYALEQFFFFGRRLYH